MTAGRAAIRSIFWLAVVMSLIAAMIPNPASVGVSDKTQHFVLFAGLTALAVAAYPVAGTLWLAILLAALGALIEIGQLTLAIGRSGEWLDWVADIAGIGVIAATIWLYQRTRHSRTLAEKRQ